MGNNPSALVRLKDLASKATPGPWLASAAVDRAKKRRTGVERRGIFGERRSGLIASAENCIRGISQEQVDSNAAYIASLRPSLVTALVEVCLAAITRRGAPDGGIEDLALDDAFTALEKEIGK